MKNVPLAPTLSLEVTASPKVSFMAVTSRTLRLFLLCVVALVWQSPSALAQPTGPSATKPPAAKAAPPDKVQLSFSGADINIIVKWLAEMTGKSIIKHKDVKVKLNILSSQEIPREEAIRLVYRAMALEGFSALESNNLIVIVPEKMEGKVSPELFNGSDTVAQGKQTVIKFYDLKHARAGALKEKLKAVLSDKAKFEVDERANKVIVTDYAENVRFLSEPIKQLDVPEASESTVDVFPLVHTEAANMAGLVKAIFEQEGETAEAAVKIIADNDSNRLVVTAPNGRMTEVRNLVNTLDTTKPADVAVRIIPLHHVQAQELVGELRNMYRKLGGKSLKESIEIAANALSNSLIVLSSQSNYDAIVTLIKQLDTEDAQQKAMKIFALRHADAQDIADQLEELHALNRRNSGYFYYSSRNSNRGELRFVAMRRTNEVVAVGPPNALERIQETIDMLDKPAGAESLAPRIYPLRFVDSETIAQVLNDMFAKKEERPYWFYDEAQDDRDVGRLYGKVRIAAVPSSNSLIITTNSTENFAALENVLGKLDVRNQDNETTLSIPLQHAKATQIANNLNILFAPPGAPNRRQTNPNQRNNPQRNNQNGVTSNQDFALEDNDQEEAFFPWLGGGNQQRRGNRPVKAVSDLIGMVRIVPDNRTNSLLVTTSPHYFPQVLGLLSDLDVPTAQVMIEAKIVEISTDDRDRLGVRWSPDGGLVFDPDDFDGSFSGSSTLDYSRIFVGTALADATRSGILNSGVNLDILVQFLRKNTNSKVRAEPRINVADNERGKLFVGARVPFISSSLRTTEGGENVQFDYVDVGIILEVTPHINSKGDVTLKIRVEASQIRQGETLFGGAILDTRNYRTEMTVASNSTMVLGGIIQREESEVVRKVPLLGDIPLLGYLFKKRDTVVRDVELLVFLRPVVARNAREAQELLEVERNRAGSILEWERQLEEARDGR